MAKLFEARDGDYIQLPWARFVFHNNEWAIDGSGVNDPTGGSFIGGDGAKLSWKNSQGEEMVLFQMRRNTKDDGEYYFGALNQARYAELKAKGDPKALDHAMIEVVTINPSGVEFRVPVKFSAGSSGLAESGRTDTMWAPTGLFFTQQQVDGNFVTYHVDVPFNKGANPQALWSSGVVQPQ